MELKLETNQSRVGLREAVEGGREKGWEGEIWWKRETEVAGGEAAAGARPPPLSLFCDRSGPGGAAGVRVRPSRRAHAEPGGWPPGLCAVRSGWKRGDQHLDGDAAFWLLSDRPWPLQRSNRKSIFESLIKFY